MPEGELVPLTRSDTLATDASLASTGLVKVQSSSIPASQKAGKPAQSAPRVELEQLYTSLKSGVGENWTIYKDAVSQFALGFLNHEELSRLTDPFIAIDVTREHLHNQLLCAIYANAHRDAPESAVATWVSANDKPTTVSKPISGDAAEQRLKVEVMQLPPRVRHRIKAIQDEPAAPLTTALLAQTNVKRMQHVSQPTLGSSNPTPTSATTAGLNKDLEIRRRYNIPLISEAHDLPSLSALTDRLLPTCYEEGLQAGPASSTSCTDLLTSALELFVKETLTAMLGRTRSDAPISVPDGAATSAPGQGSVSAVGLGVGTSTATPGAGVVTAHYKRALEAEEAACKRGELKRSELGLLPCEVASSRAQGNGKGLPGDLRLAVELGDAWLDGMMPWLPERVLASDYAGYGPDSAQGGDEDDDDEEEEEEEEQWELEEQEKTKKKKGGLGGLVKTITRDALMTDGDAHANGFDLALLGDDDDDDAMDVDSAEWTWQGGKAPERAMLSSLLDDCLAVG